MYLQFDLIITIIKGGKTQAQTMKPITNGLKQKTTIIIDPQHKKQNEADSDIEDIYDVDDFQLLPTMSTTNSNPRSHFHPIAPIRKIIEKSRTGSGVGGNGRGIGGVGVRRGKIQEVVSDQEEESQGRGDRGVMPMQNQEKRYDVRKRLMKVSNKSKIEGKQYCCTQCSICLSSLEAKLPHEIGRLLCKHAFCFDCILQSSKFSNRCPYCRSPYYQINRNGEQIEVQQKDLEQDFDPYDEPCYVCGRNDDFDHLLECEYCEAAFCHTYCDNRLESDVPPEESWYCLSCSNLLES